uniref:lonely Cys domain-containing protein n=1 Tax=Streptomyces sp. PU-14G TaxID=2800808 RepID=UPI0034DED8E3
PPTDPGSPYSGHPDRRGAYQPAQRPRPRDRYTDGRFGGGHPGAGRHRAGRPRGAHPGDGRPGDGRPGDGRPGDARTIGGRLRRDRRTAHPYAAPFRAGLRPDERLALARLDRLRSADPELRGGPLDTDRLARRVLLLAPQERVTGELRAELLRLASSFAAEDVRSLAGLSALYLVRRGALDDRFRITDTRGRPRGLNWTDTPVPADLDLATTAVRTDGPQGSTVGEVGSALWATGPGRPDAYLLVASGGRRVLVKGRAGFAREVPAEVLGELMVLDRDLAAQPWDVPVALMVPGFARGLAGPATLAGRLDRAVVATSGVPAVMYPAGQTASPVFGLVDEVGRPRGTFVLAPPGPVRPATATPGWERDADIFPIATADGWMTGFVSVDPGADRDGGQGRLAHAGRLPAVTSYVTYNVQLGTFSAPLNVPWPPGSTGFDAQHGGPGSVTWATAAGPQLVSGIEHARALVRWFSLSQSLPNRTLLICFSAARPGVGGVVLTGNADGPLPFVPDPLGVVPVGQDVANETGETVYGPLYRISTTMNADGEVVVSVWSNVRGEGAFLVKFRPEPKGAALDERARTAGLHRGPRPASEADRQRALRLVRALREVFHDPDIDDRPDYPYLLRGIGALDRMRELDPLLDRDGVRAFTLDLLQRVVRGFGPATSSAAPGTPERIREVLGWADAAWQSGPRPLSRFAVLPHLATALGRLPALGTPEAVAAAREILGAGPGQPAGEAELSRLLWSDVRVLELLETLQDRGRFAAALLHLEGPDPARFGEAAVLARKAFAAGRSTFPELAAYHLELQGALSDRTLGRDSSGAISGRDLGQGSAGLDGDFDHTVITLLDYGPDGRLVEVGTAPAPWYAPGRPVPFPYVFDGRFLGAPVPKQEFGELVFRDRELHGAPVGADIILVGDGARPPVGVPVGETPAGEGVRNSGRTVWATYGRTGIHRRPGSRRYTVYVAPDAWRPRPLASDWGPVRPRDLQPSAAAPPSSVPGHAYGTGTRAQSAGEPAEAPAAPSTVQPADVPAAPSTGEPANAPAAPSQDTETLALTWDEHTRARELVTETAAAGPDAVQQWGEAMEWLEDAEARLYALGVPPRQLAALAPRGGDTAPALGDDRRAWLAGRVTKEDLSPDAPRLAPDAYVDVSELRALGVLTQSQEMEAVLGGGRLAARTLSPLVQVRLLLRKPGPGPDGIDAVAATVARRLWRSAFDAFAAATAPREGASSQDGTEPGDDAATTAALAWDLAVFLVLPGVPDAARADARYAGEAFHAAVRDVAEHLQSHGPDARSAVELADTRRRELGLRPRWTEADPSAPSRPRPVVRSTVRSSDVDIPDAGSGPEPESSSEAESNAESGSGVERQTAQDGAGSEASESSGLSDATASAGPALAALAQAEPAPAASAATPVPPPVQDPAADETAPATPVFTAPVAESALPTPVQRLDALRQKDPRSAAGPLDVAALARRILHLDPDATVDDAVREELFALVEAAVPAGRATSVTALAALHAERQGVLDAPYRFTERGRPAGLNWKGTLSTEIDTSVVERYRPTGDGGLQSAGASLAEWPENAYVVAADGSHNSVEVPWPNGTFRSLDIDEFVELMKHDPVLRGLPPNTSVVLAVQRGGDRIRALPRLLAARTGRDVWAYTGVVTARDTVGGPVTLRTVRTEGSPGGDWLRTTPGKALAHDTGVPDWYDRVLVRPIVSGTTGKQTGYSVFSRAELAASWERRLRAADRVRTFVYYNPAARTYSEPFEVPGADEKTFEIVLHGAPGTASVELQDGSRRILSGDELERWVAHLLSSVDLDGDTRISLMMCWAGSPADSAPPQPGTARHTRPGTFVADPLADIPTGQIFANAARRPVRVAHRETGIKGRGRYQRTLFTDHRGRRLPFTYYVPEPDRAGLDRLARVAGLHEGDAQVPAPVRERTLRLVRALRLTFGNEVEADADYAGLLRGAAALDRMWRSDPAFRGAGPFTLDLLRHVGRAHGTPLPDGGVRVDEAAYRAALGAAAGAAPGTRLSAFVPLPAVAQAAAWAAATDLTQAAVDALALSGPDAVGDAERSRLFWARAKVWQELPRPGTDLDLTTARALHLRSATPVDDARREELRTLATAAFARGLDATDADALSAFHLETLGAFGSATQLSDTAGDSTGRDYTPGAGPGVLDTTQIRRGTRLEDAPWHRRRRDGTARPAPYVVRGTADPADPEFLLMDFGTGPLRVSFQELEHLLRRDPGLLRRGLKTDLVLDIAGLPDGYGEYLADTLSQGTGRRTWYVEADTDLSGTGTAGSSVLTTHPVGERDPRWDSRRPVDPRH